MIINIQFIQTITPSAYFCCICLLLSILYQLLQINHKRKTQKQPMQNVKLLPSQRHKLILESIQKSNFVTISDMAKMCGVSEMTLRRDLDTLHRQNRLRRTHGGAQLFDQSDGSSNGIEEPNIKLRTTQNQEAKLGIAQSAAKIINTTQTIALDVGSTTYELAVLLQNTPLRVFTNSLRVAGRLGQSRPNVYVPGGHVGGTEPAIYGAQAIELLRKLNYDIAFLGAAGFLDDGFYDYSPEDSEIKRVLIECANKVVMLLDSSKFGRLSVVKFSNLSDIDMLITDICPPNNLKKALSDAGVELVIARPNIK